LQDKKKAEEERQKELNALFAVAIKQPKVPPGVTVDVAAMQMWAFEWTFFVLTYTTSRIHCCEFLCLCTAYWAQLDIHPTGGWKREVVVPWFLVPHGRLFS
jgi:hypothetical protein